MRSDWYKGSVPLPGIRRALLDEARSLEFGVQPASSPDEACERWLFFPRPHIRDLRPGDGMFLVTLTEQFGIASQWLPVDPSETIQGFSDVDALVAEMKARWIPVEERLTQGRTT